MLYDFHTHTFLSDGVLSPAELIRRAAVKGYTAIGLADHVGLGNFRQVLEAVIDECRAVQQHWNIQAIPGIEITHVPPQLIDTLAKQAKETGAEIVVVHGETSVEPVEPGTNLAAIMSPHVDVLAHPGFLTEEEAELASRNETFLEVSARKGHSLTNGYVVKLARKAGALMIVDSDAHEPGDLLTAEFAARVARGAGIEEKELDYVLRRNPGRLLRRIGREVPMDAEVIKGEQR